MDLNKIIIISGERTGEKVQNKSVHGMNNDIGRITFK